MGASESTTIKERLEGKPVVVILGGGYAGFHLAKALDQQFNVLVIERRQYFYHNVASLRAVVEPSFAPLLAIPYDKMLKYGYVIQAEIEEVNPTGVKIKGRETVISFDYLVIATGAAHYFPAKTLSPDFKGLVYLFQETHKVVESASKITVVGAGPVGIELTGELSYKYPEKEITLIHAHEKLSLENTPDYYHENVITKVRALPNVKLILGERAILDDIPEFHQHKFASGKRTLKTDKGTEIETDLIFFCPGSKPNTDCVKQHFGDKLDEHGRIKVNPFLQVEGCENIFAIGDCANIPEGKLSLFTTYQAAHCAKNIGFHASDSPLYPYKSNPPALFLTIGPNLGTGLLPIGGLIIGNTLVSYLKGRNLFVNRYWGELNQTPPKEGESAFNLENDRNRKLLELSRLSSFMKVPDLEAKRIIEDMAAEDVVVNPEDK